MNRNMLKRSAAMLLASLTILNTTVVFADYRDAGGMERVNQQSSSKNDAVYLSPNGQRYYPHDEGGYTVNVPYNDEALRDSGSSVPTQMFNYLFDIYKTGQGSNYESAGFKYNGLDAKYPLPNGNKARHFVKTVSFESFNRSFESQPATSDIGRDDFKVEFRYTVVL